MKPFEAVTATGTLYRYNGTTITVETASSRAESPYTFKPLALKVVNRLDLPGGIAARDVIHDLPDSDLPTVGLSLYVSGIYDWRLSTPILEVRELN